MERICLFCKHFWIIAATYGYSEATLGNDFDMICSKNNWQFDSFDITLGEYRKMMLTAKTCKYFKED